MFELTIRADSPEALKNEIAALLGALGAPCAVNVREPVSPIPAMPSIVPVAAPAIPTPIVASTTPAAPPVVPIAPVPTTAVAEQYRLDQLQIAMGGLVDAGKMQTVQKIMAEFGVCAVTEIPEDAYPALVAKLRQEGAKI